MTMAVVLDLGLLLQPVGADDCHAALLFVTGVLVVARSTNGYFYGMTASLIAASGRELCLYGALLPV